MYLKYFSGGGSYATEAAHLGGVVERPEIVPVPMAPGHVAGIFLSRGRVWTAVDPGIATGRAPAGGHHAILLESSDGDLAILAESLGDMVDGDGGDKLEGSTRLTPASVLEAVSSAISAATGARRGEGRE